jgi:tetratricopeptide (TPR) repeat protein/tRNA A-37 threonylcarbamoyl transferase component Bud32
MGRTDGPEGATPPSLTRGATKACGPLQRIKHYALLSLIGRGGMGEVYLAHDAKLDRRVAIKFLPDELHKDPKARERFLREAKAAAALDHPFICKVFEAGEFQGRSYIVMEYVEGKSLRDKIAEGPFSLAAAIRAALEVCEALEAAHAKGIVHRDLKPSNLMCTPQGHIKVMDFGLAKHIVSEPAGTPAQTLSRTMTADPAQLSITTPGVVVGTIAYMSPEQARGEPVDARTDIFSFGVVLDEMISGKHPFDKGTPLETLTAVLRDDPPPVHVKPKVLDPDLGRILGRALAKDALARYQTITEMADDLRKLQADVAPRTWLGFRSPWPLVGILAGAAAIVVGGVMFLRGPQVGNAPAGPKPVKVLIADFENKTGDPVFDGALEQTFAIGLEGASFVTLYDRGQARQLAGQIDPQAGGRLDKNAALLVGRREGINVVVQAVIEQNKSGGGYTIRTQAIDPVSSDVLAENSETIPTKAGVLKAADLLAARLRASFEGVPVESIKEASKETFTAASLEAMKAYARAQDLTTAGKDAEAIKEYLKALELDPNLGRAYAGLGIVYRNHGELEEAKKYYEKAMGFLDQMTDREKLRTRGGYYFVNRNYKKAIEEFGALKAQFPMDLAALTNLPLACFLARDMPKAFEEGKKAVEAYPDRVNPLYNLAWYALAVDRLEEAEAAAQKVIKLDPGFAEAKVCLGLIRLAQGRTGDAAAEYRRLEGTEPNAASLEAAGQADLALYEGRRGDARKILEAAIPADIKNNLNSLATQKRLMLAEVLASFGRPGDALKVVEEALAGTSNESVLYSGALIMLGAGKDERVRGLVSTLTVMPSPEPQAYARLVEGEVDLLKGNFPEAIKNLHEAQNQVDTWIGHVSLGRAYLAAGQFTEAYSEFEGCLKRRGEAASVFLDDLPTMNRLPQIYYYLGRAQEGLKSPGAKGSYKKFLEIKILAAGDPLVEDAKRRLGQLIP